MGPAAHRKRPHGCHAGATHPLGMCSSCHWLEGFFVKFIHLFQAGLWCFVRPSVPQADLSSLLSCLLKSSSDVERCSGAGDLVIDIVCINVGWGAEGRLRLEVLHTAQHDSTSLSLHLARGILRRGDDRLALLCRLLLGAMRRKQAQVSALDWRETHGGGKRLDDGLRLRGSALRRGVLRGCALCRCCCRAC